MPVMDEFREEREEIRKQGPKARLAYFWDYYKWHVIAGVVGVIVLISIIHTFATRKDTVFYAVFMNIPSGLRSAEYKEGFAEYIGVDLEEYNITFDTDMHYDPNTMDNATVATAEKMMVYTAAGDMDVLLADISGLNRYAYNDSLMDLREFLTPEEYEKYEPYFYYMDHSLIEDLEFNEDITQFPQEPSDPSAMEKPIPVGIYLEQSPGLKECYPVTTPHYFSVICNTSRQEYAHQFLEYVWEY